MEHEKVLKAIQLNNRIIDTKIELKHVEEAYEECKNDQTKLYWSAYGCMSLVDGWGRNDVKPVMDALRLKLINLEAELAEL